MSSRAAKLPAFEPLIDEMAVAQQAAAVLTEQQHIVFQRADRLLAGLMVLQWAVFILHVIRGSKIDLHTPGHSVDGLGLAVLLTLASLFLALVSPGRPTTRYVLAISQILLCFLLKPFNGSPYDIHFHIFGVLAFLALYRDWRVLVPASLTVCLRPLFFDNSFGNDPWVWLEQVGGVLAEDILLWFYCHQSQREMYWNAGRTAFLEAADSVIRVTKTQSRRSENVWRDAHERLNQELAAGERRRTEELAHANEALLRNLSVLHAQQEATIDGLLIVNEDRRVSSYNQRFCELWNIPEDLISDGEDGMMLEHLLSCVRHPDLFLCLVDRCYENPQEQRHDEVELNDGRILDRDTRPVFSDAGQCFGRVWYFRDITERKKAEVQILSLNRELTRAYEAMAQAYDATIEGWSRALDLRDKETEGHSRRVTGMTMQMAVALGLCGEDLIQIRRGALLHDIGKMGIPDNILLKPSVLAEDEWAIMRRHPTYAYEMLSPIQFLRPALDIPFCHHEKWDGTGYPRGLAGEEIPLAARLFAVVDIWDALRSDRPYRKAWPEQKVRTYIQALAGTHLDPGLVPVFLSIISEEDMLSDPSLFRTINLQNEASLLDELARAA